MPCAPSQYQLLGGLLMAVWLGPASQAATNSLQWLKVPRSSNEGLPNNTVGGLAQTPDGYIWLGTPNGLARFDGVRFDEYAPTNFIESPNRGILTMSSASDGGLWLGMDRGAVVGIHGSRRSVFLPDPQLSRLAIDSLTEDNDHNLWIAYRTGVARRLSPEDRTRAEEIPGLPRGIAICSFTLDSKGRLWCSKGGSLGIIREGRFQAITNYPPEAARLAPARAGGIWMVAGFHLYHYDEAGALRDFGAFKPLRGGTEPTEIMESRDGAVWIGTTFSGLHRFDGREFEYIPTSHPEILSLLEDAEGNIWVGTGGGGLDQVRPRVVALESSEAGLPFDAVQSLCEDTSGTIWAATQNGSLARQIKGRWQALPNDGTWAGDAFCVCADPSGGVWVGTRLHRLLRWQNGAFVPWGDNTRVKGQTIHTLVVARNGDVWLGEDTPSAVQRLRNGVLEDFELPSNLRVIRATAEDAAGNMWFGDSQGVLLRITGNQVINETAHTTGEPQSIRSLYATPDGALWITYAGWGVGRYKNGHYSVINTHQGLYDDFVSQMVGDHRGWFWFAANRGIFKVRQEEMDAVAEGRAARVRSIRFGQGDGLPSLQANFGNSPNSLQSSDGRIWLAMRTALAVVDPNVARESVVPAPVLISRIATGERAVAVYRGALPAPGAAADATPDLAALKTDLKIPPDHRRVEFEYTALSFIAPENMNFRYRLRGLEDDWTDAGTERHASYPRLPPGPYRFEVDACNSAGEWTETGASVSFAVTPFFWQTWWFRGAVIGSFTLLLVALVRYVSFRRLRLRLRQLEAQAALHKERARIAKDIHDDLGANLTQISLIGELARQDRTAPDKVGAHVEKISAAARQAVKSLDEIVWAVNPRNDTLAHFIDYTGQFALDYLQVAGIRCRLDLPEQVPARELSTDVRHNLFLVVKEAINNTVKYAQATELHLGIQATNEKLEILIEDNGQGFDQPPEHSGADGLHNMQERLADIGGVCHIDGRAGGGTRISVTLPWPHETHAT